MSINLLIQYTLVGICILGACIWIVVKAVKKNNKKSGCCGCSLADLCQKPEKNTESENTNECREKVSTSGSFKKSIK